MNDIEYDYTSPGAARIRTTAAGISGPPPVSAGAAPQASPYAMPDMDSMMRWAMQQRAEREGREDAARAKAAMAASNAAAREEDDAEFARKMALRQQALREQAMRDEEAEASRQDPYYVKMRQGQGIISGYMPVEPGTPGAVAAGYMPRALAARRGGGRG